MNQNFVAGLGNIYVNEAIFLSKINPKLRVNNISNKKINVIISKIKKILKKQYLKEAPLLKILMMQREKRKLPTVFQCLWKTR